MLLELLKQYKPEFCTVAVVIVLSIIQISKININPWSFIMKCWRRIMKSHYDTINEPVMMEIKKMGEIFNRRMDEVDDKIKGIKEDINKERKEREEDNIFIYRNEIITAANTLRNGYSLTRSKYDYIIDIHTRYENIISKYGFENGKVEYDFNYIMERMKEEDSKGNLGGKKNEYSGDS